MISRRCDALEGAHELDAGKGGLGYTPRITQAEFNNVLLQAGLVAYTVKATDDEVVVPAVFNAGVHVLNLMGQHAGDPALFDGQHIYISDPFGRLAAGTILRVVGRTAGVGAQLALGAAAVDSFDMVVPGQTLGLVFSSATGTWNMQLAGDGPGGSAVTLGGDLLGTGSTAAAPRVGSLTGIAGVLAIATTAALFQWAAATVTPKITQADTGGATGATLTVQAQNALTTGGKLALSSGTGVTAGNVELQLGGVAALTLSPTLATLVTSLAIGAAPATVGDVRVPGASEYRFGAANVCAFSTMPNSGPGAELILGGDFAGVAGVVNSYVNGTSSVYITQGTATVTHQFSAAGGVTQLFFYKDQPALLATRTDQNLVLGTNSLARLTLSSLVGAFATPAVSIGAAPATVGTIRTPQATEFRFNNGGTDICAFSTGAGGGASGNAAFGADQAGVSAVSQVSLNAKDGGNIFLAFGAATTVVGYRISGGTTLQEFWADQPATIQLRSIGVATASPLSIFGQPTTTVGGDLRLGGGDTSFGGTAGFVDFRNQAIGTGGGSIAGGTLLTGLLAKTVPIKVNGAAFFMVVLG